MLEGILYLRFITIRFDYFLRRKAEAVLGDFGMIGDEHTESIQQFTLRDVLGFFLDRDVKGSSDASLAFLCRSLNFDFL